MSAILWLISSTAGRIILGVVAFMIWLGLHDAKVADRARSECQAAQIAATLKEVERQRDVARQVLAAAEKQADDDAREIANLEREKDDITKSLGEAGRVSCAVPDAAIRRLRAIH